MIKPSSVVPDYTLYQAITRSPYMSRRRCMFQTQTSIAQTINLQERKYSQILLVINLILKEHLSHLEKSSACQQTVTSRLMLLSDARDL